MKYTFCWHYDWIKKCIRANKKKKKYFWLVEQFFMHFVSVVRLLTRRFDDIAVLISKFQFYISQIFRFQMERCVVNPFFGWRWINILYFKSNDVSLTSNVAYFADFNCMLMNFHKKKYSWLFWTMVFSFLFFCV